MKAQNAERRTNAGRFLAISYLLLAIGLVSAQSAADITKQVQANLEKSPWEANIVGKLQLPDGSSQEADFQIKVLPGKDQLARVEFKKPASLEGNFVLISDKEVWNYLFLTNQLIITPRAKAKVEGLGVNLTALGDFEELTKKMDVKVLGEEKTDEGPAWKLVGSAKDTSVGFDKMEMLVLKADPRPLQVRVKDKDGRLLAELNFKSFKRANLTAKMLKKYPADAEVVRK